MWEYPSSPFSAGSNSGKISNSPSISLPSSFTSASLALVRTSASEAEVKEEGREIEGELEIFPEFEPALNGLEGYSHIFLIFYFHKLRPEQIGPLQVKPKRLGKRGFTVEGSPTLGRLA